MKRKIFMLIVLALTALFVGQAYADSTGIIDLGEDNYTSPGDKIINLTGSESQTIINAINIIPEGGVIILNGDFNIRHIITINKPLTIKSINGSTLKVSPERPKIRGIRCLAKGIVLENLNITNGYSPLGGLDINNCSIDIINCKIFGNSSNEGGGICIQGKSSLRMVNCEVSGNVALFGGGISSFLSVHTTLEMINCKVTGNKSAGAGGGLRLFDITAQMINCDISGNTVGEAEEGGGIYIRSSTVQAINCNISGNTPDDIKGTITIDGEVYSSEYSNDTKDSGSGGGCDTVGLGLMAAAIAFTLWRKR